MVDVGFAVSVFAMAVIAVVIICMSTVPKFLFLHLLLHCFPHSSNSRSNSHRGIIIPHLLASPRPSWRTSSRRPRQQHLLPIILRRHAMQSRIIRWVFIIIPNLHP